MTQAGYLILAGLHAGILESDASFPDHYFNQNQEMLSAGKAAQYVRQALFPGAQLSSTGMGQHAQMILTRTPLNNQYVIGTTRYTIQNDGSVTTSDVNPLRTLFKSGAPMTYKQKLAYQMPWEQIYG